MSQLSIIMLRNSHRSGKLLRNLLLEQKTRTKLFAPLSTSTRLLCSDKYKSDPDIKKFLSEINDDFGKKDKIHKDDKIDNKKSTSDETNENSNATNNDNVQAKRKDLEDLLSQLYSQPESSKENIDDQQSKDIEEDANKADVPGLAGYARFKDEDAQIIYDVEEERRLLLEAQDKGEEIKRDKRKKSNTKYGDIAMTRGKEGVFDLHEIVQVLKDEKLEDLAVIRIPKERVYADYFVIGTGRNARHIYVISQIILKLYKSKAALSDPSLILDGIKDKGSSGWIAMDLGNVVVHLFLQEKRDYYSLETLWTLGAEFDEHSQVEEDPLEQLMTTNIPAEFMRIEPDIAMDNNDINEMPPYEVVHDVPPEDNVNNIYKEEDNDDFIAIAMKGKNKDGRTLA